MTAIKGLQGRAPRMPANGSIPGRRWGHMPSNRKKQSGHPVADIRIVMRRATPMTSLICPGCGKQRDFAFVSSAGYAVQYDIQCPDCGTVRIGCRMGKEDLEFFFRDTGAPYDPRAAISEAEQRAKAVRGDLPKESLAMAELAWETYLFEPTEAPEAWKGAVDRFVACEGSDREHARLMIPRILRFCELGGDSDLKDINLRACTKAAKIVGAPETADECMLMMELFNLLCCKKAIAEDRFRLPYEAKEAYLSLPEEEKAKRPDFPVLWPLIFCDRALEYWMAGAIRCDEPQLNRIETDLWNEAMLELEKMLASGAPMTPRIFMLLTDHARHQMMLAAGVENVRRRLEALAGMSGEYEDAFRGLAELLVALVMVRGEPLMPFVGGGRYRWSREALDMIYDAIEKLEHYPDPAVTGNLLIDAYFLLYEHDGNPDIMDNCTTMEWSVSDRLLELRLKAYLYTPPSEFPDGFMDVFPDGQWGKSRFRGRGKGRR